MVRGVVEWVRDGCVVREGRVLVLYRGRMLVVIVFVVIVFRVFETY